MRSDGKALRPLRRMVVSLLAFVMPNRMLILQAHRITTVALYLRVFQGIIIFLREAR